MKRQSAIQIKHRCRGFNLIELMVAMSVGLIVLLGILEVLMNISRSYRVQNAVNHLNESGQYALTYLARDVRDIGFWGCLMDISVANNLINTLGTGYNASYYSFATPISGTSATVGSFPRDSILIQGASNIGSGARLLTPYPTTTSSNLNIFTNNGLVQGQLLMVSDCQAADIFQVTNNDVSSSGSIQHGMGVAGINPGNTDAAFSKVYGNMATVYSLFAYQYSIGTGVNGLPALMRTTSTGTQELVNNVQGFVIYYGLDTNNDKSVNQYTRTPTIAQWPQVVSIRFELLLFSQEDNLLPSPQSYYFDYTTTTPPDKRIYRVYEQTVALKNRVL